MFIKYSKKLNPKKTKPFFKKNLNINNKKLRELSEKIHSLKFVDINACLICASKKLGQLFVSRNYIWMQCKKMSTHAKKGHASLFRITKFLQNRNS